MNINRRSFVKNASGLAIGALTPVLAMESCKSSPSTEKSAYDPLQFDVVVGAGTAGVPAAVAAAREGVRVVLLEEDMIPGGGPVICM